MSKQQNQEATETTAGKPLPPRVHPAMNDCYAEAEDFDPSLYDALEIHGVRDLNPPNAPQGTCCEIDDDNPEFFSTYAHCKEGGVECVGDFGTYELALQYAVVLSRKNTWPIHDHVTEKFRLPVAA